MVIWILTFLVVLILCAVKLPSTPPSNSGEMTESRRRELRKKGQQSSRGRDPGGLPWFGNRKRQRKKQKYFWDD